MNKYFLIGTILGSLICFAGFIYFSFSNYQSRMKTRYSIKNYFPYELNYDFSFKENLLGNCFLFISILLYASSFVVPLFNRLNGFYIAIFIGGLLASFVPLALVFTPINAGKIHIIMVCASFFVSIINAGLIAIQCRQIFADIHYNLGLLGMIIAMIIALALLIIILNPKLKNWADMETKKNEDGTVTYIRPKYFVLAFSEWLLIILNYASLIALFFMIFSLK